MKRNLQKIVALGIVSMVSFFYFSGYIFDKNETNTKEKVLVEPELVLCYGEVNPEGHIMTESAKYFAKQVEELSHGNMVVEIYPSGQMGDDAQCYEALKMGALDLYRGNAASLAECGDLKVSLLVLPYIFKSREHFWNVCKSELGLELLEDIKEHHTGMMGVAYLDEGVRNFFTTERPIKTLEDMKGMKIRMQISELMEDTVKALGAKAVPIAYAELYTALESRSVDGAENPPVSYYYNHFYEEAPYYIKDGHTYAPGIILVSQITWKNLTAEQQKVIVDAARMTEVYNRAELEKADAQAYEMMEWMGVKVVEPEDMDKWREAMKPVYQKYGSSHIDLIKKIMDMQ